MMAARLVYSSVSKQSSLSQRHPYRMFQHNDGSRTTCGLQPHTTSNSPLLESHEPVELADEVLLHFVFLPRQDLEFASDQASGSQTLLECVRVFAAWDAEGDAHVVDVPVEWTHEGEPSVLYREASVSCSAMECDRCGGRLCTEDDNGSDGTTYRTPGMSKRQTLLMLDDLQSRARLGLPSR